MGILDDAIREHLDLKRKHGAREGEVQQLEDEAFGPPTRPDEPDFPERPPTGEEAVVAEAATEEGVAEPALDESELLAAPEEPSPELASGAIFDQDFSEAAAPPPPLAPEPLPPVPGEEPEAIAGEPTVEHPAPTLEPEEEEASAAVPEAPPAEEGEPAPAGELDLDEEFEEFRETEGEEGEEDVLEETPEFLRDTPENERLWFEQGEPQDFDFDDEEEGEDRPA